MGVFVVLILGLIVVGGNLTNNPSNKNIEKEKIEVVDNKSIKPEPVKEEIKPEPVKEEIKPEPVKEEIKPEPVKEEIKPEPVKEEIKPEPVKEEIKELVGAEDSGTNYLNLVLYIIGIILVALAGMYFFLRKQNKSKVNTQSETTEPQPAEDNIQSETTEPQPAEDNIQSETTEPQPIKEDENNNK